MSTLRNIKALTEVGYREGEVVAALGITYAEYRQALHRLDLPLPVISLGARTEIYERYNSLEPDIKAISVEYHTSMPAVVQALKAPSGVEDMRIPPDDELREMSQHFTPEELSEQLGVPVRRVVNAINRLKKASSYLTELDKQQILKYLDQGMRQADVARMYNITPARVSQINKHKLKHKKHNLEADWNLIRDLYKQGFTVSKLAKQFNLAKSTIYGKLRQ